MPVTLSPCIYSLLVERVFSQRASGLQCPFFLEGRSRRTIEPLMCSDIIFGYSPITQPKVSQTKDLHGGPSLGAAGGSNAAFQKGLVGKHRRGAPAQGQDPCLVRATETGRGALAVSLWRQQLALFRQQKPQPSCSTGQELREDLSKARASKASQPW